MKISFDRSVFSIIRCFDTCKPNDIQCNHFRVFMTISLMNRCSLQPKLYAQFLVWATISMPLGQTCTWSMHACIILAGVLKFLTPFTTKTALVSIVSTYLFFSHGNNIKSYAIRIIVGRIMLFYLQNI